MTIKSPIRATRTRILQGESLEPRRLLTVSMSDYEQLVLELVNQARANPLAEVARNTKISSLNQGLNAGTGTISSSPKQPLAAVQSLVNAAGAHSQDMLNFNYFSHTGRNGSSPTTRAQAQGYANGVGENIGWSGSTGSINFDQQTRAIHENLFASPGHRLNIMQPSYEEIGTGVRFGSFTSNRTYNAAMVTEAFGSRSGDSYITGVVYEDGGTIDDDFYSIGEGLENVLIRAVNVNGGTYSTTSGPSGGYNLAVPAGSYTVTAVGQNMSFNTTIASINVKVDFDTSQAPPVVTAPISSPGDDLVALNAGEEFWLGRSAGSTFDTSSYGRWPSNSEFTHFGSGDLNQDGQDDMVGRQADGSIRVALSTGGNAFEIAKWGAYPNSVTWTDFHVADFTGDGLADVIARATSNGDWWLGRSTGSSFVMERWGNFSRNVQWQTFFGDFNGDGREDVLGRAESNGSWWAGISTGQQFANARWARWTTNAAWSDFRVGDFNGDGRDDIAGRARNREWWVGVSNGSQFEAHLWGSWTPTVTWSDVRVGDFDGDGDDDIAGRANGQWWIAMSNPDNQQFTNRLWGYWTTNTTWRDVRVLDVNDDGRDDLLGRAANGEWWNFQSNGTRFTGVLAAKWSPGASWQHVVVGDFV